MRYSKKGFILILIIGFCLLIGVTGVHAWQMFDPYLPSLTQF